ncbi:MAG: hypothetical protein IJ083_13800 [Clostridia bacterium]|nr:hypothetical protein [Clostridia bacterium]
MKNGVRTGYQPTAVTSHVLYLRLTIDGRQCSLSWSCDGGEYQGIGPVFDTSEFSDEYCKFGEFTGTMVGITCADRMFHRHYADFDFLEVTSV